MCYLCVCHCFKSLRNKMVEMYWKNILKSAICCTCEWFSNLFLIIFFSFFEHKIFCHGDNLK